MSAALTDIPIYYAHDIDRIARPGGPHLPEGWAPPGEEGYLWGLWLEWVEGLGAAELVAEVMACSVLVVRADEADLGWALGDLWCTSLLWARRRGEGERVAWACVREALEARAMRKRA